MWEINRYSTGGNWRVRACEKWIRKIHYRNSRQYNIINIQELQELPPRIGTYEVNDIFPSNYVPWGHCLDTAVLNVMKDTIIIIIIFLLLFFLVNLKCYLKITYTLYQE